MSNSTKPSGLKITRDGNRFICEWKIPSAKYGDGQKFKATGVSERSIGKTLTKKTVVIDLSSKYPDGEILDKFTFSVKGNTDKSKDNKGWSKWATKSLDLLQPSDPTLTPSNTGTNKYKVEWSVPDVNDSNNRPFKRVVIQVALVPKCSYTDEEIPDSYWKEFSTDDPDYTGTQSGYPNNSSGYVEITDNSETLASGSYRRAVRVRAQGAGGETGWIYTGRTYATPNQSIQTGGTEVTQEIPGGYNVPVTWDTAYDRETPLDYSIIQWLITEPESDMSCPTSGVTWNDGPTVYPTQSLEAAQLTVGSTVGRDKCLYTRVNSVYDSITVPGTATLRKVGALSAPTLTTVTPDQANSQVIITAANNSPVDDTEIEVIYRKNGADTIIASAASFSNTVIKCPAWENTDAVTFGVRAVLPKTSSYTTDSSGVKTYTIDPYMESEVVWWSLTVAVAPSGLTLNRDGSCVRAKWKNNWLDATDIELSWSDDPDAWESTEQPEKYTINNPFTTSWKIIGLEPGRTWYVKARAIHDDGEKETHSPYSAAAQINLSSAPSKPILVLSAGILAAGELFTASWDYESTDGTSQAEARIYTYSGGVYTELTRVSSEEYVDLAAWLVPGIYQLAVEVVSASGLTSQKSSPASITIVPPAVCSMVNSLDDMTITDDDENTRTVKALTELPLTATVTGADDGGTTSLVITRAEDYHVERPDGSDQNGNKDETIASLTQTGSDQMSIGLNDLIGTLDDGARYTLTAIVKDSLGQAAKSSVDFEVHWEDQAIIPKGEYLIDAEEKIAVISVIAPDGASESATCDIYRLSADKPVLIFKGAEFGKSYVDPYPAVGNSGGYRLVYITECGDYNTAENVLAFYDMYDDQMEGHSTIIDFDGEQIELAYDLKFSSQWEKDFVTKKHLGGSVKGYWRKGVERKGSVAAVAIPRSDKDLIEAMRRLCEHEGECHIRTPEGSSFTANVQVQEKWDNGRGSVSFDLSITRTEPATEDGMTLNEWEGES